MKSKATPKSTVQLQAMYHLNYAREVVKNFKVKMYDAERLSSKTES